MIVISFSGLSDTVLANEGSEIINSRVEYNEDHTNAEIQFDLDNVNIDKYTIHTIKFNTEELYNYQDDNVYNLTVTDNDSYKFVIEYIINGIHEVGMQNIKTLEKVIEVKELVKQNIEQDESVDIEEVTVNDDNTLEDNAIKENEFTSAQNNSPALGDTREALNYNSMHFGWNNYKIHPDQEDLKVDVKSGSKIYFGKYNNEPIHWRLRKKWSSNNKDNKGAFLMSDTFLGTMKFSEDTLDYQQSDIAKYLEKNNDSIRKDQNNFTLGEQDSMLATTKDDLETETSLFSIQNQYNNLSGDKLFLPSVFEYGSNIPVTVFPEWSTAYTRSKSATGGLYSITNTNTEILGNIESIFDIYRKKLLVVAGMNLDTSKVLLTSITSPILQGGLGKELTKFNTGQIGMATGIAAGASYANSIKLGWKLTLKDDQRNNFKASITELENGKTTLNAGEKFTIKYSGAKTGANEYLSVIINDQLNSNQSWAQYAENYGRVQKLDWSSKAQGVIQVTLPEYFKDRDVTLKIFNEQYNGSCATDLASDFISIDCRVIKQQAPVLDVKDVIVSTDTKEINKQITNVAGNTYDRASKEMLDLSVLQPDLLLTYQIKDLDGKLMDGKYYAPGAYTIEYTLWDTRNSLSTTETKRIACSNYYDSTTIGDNKIEMISYTAGSSFVPSIYTDYVYSSWRSPLQAKEGVMKVLGVKYIYNNQYVTNVDDVTVDPMLTMNSKSGDYNIKVEYLGLSYTHRLIIYETDVSNYVTIPAKVSLDEKGGIKDGYVGAECNISYNLGVKFGFRVFMDNGFELFNENVRETLRVDAYQLDGRLISTSTGKMELGSLYVCYEELSNPDKNNKNIKFNLSAKKKQLPLANYTGVTKFYFERDYTK